MVDVSVREELDSPADVVWSEIQDFGSTKAWFPAAKVVEIQGSGAGATRRVQTENGIFAERCEEHDPEARRFRYSLLEDTAGIRNYVAVVEVEALTEERSALTWSCTFDCDADAVDALRQRYEDIYRNLFIASVRSHLEDGE